MESSGSHRSGLLTAGGILSIIGGALEVIGGGIMVGLVIAHREMFRLMGHGVWGGTPGIFWGPFGFVDLIQLIIVGVPLSALGIVAIVGGVSATRRKIFGLSLAGAICAAPSVFSGLYLGEYLGEAVGALTGALTSVILGILAVIFVAVGKREFRATA